MNPPMTSLHLFAILALSVFLVTVAIRAWLSYRRNASYQSVLTEENHWLVLQPGMVPKLPGVYVEVDEIGFAASPYRHVVMWPGDASLPETSVPGLGWRRIGPVEDDEIFDLSLMGD